jgi:hypothetical protein
MPFGQVCIAVVEHLTNPSRSILKSDKDEKQEFFFFETQSDVVFFCFARYSLDNTIPKNGKPNGYGFMAYANGTRHEGEWKDGVLKGNVNCIFANGQAYV